MRDTILKVLNEVLGVPEGLLESADKLYKIVFNKIKTIRPPFEQNYNFQTRHKFRILDYETKNLEVDLIIYEVDEIDSVDIYSMSYVSKSYFESDKFVLVNVFDDEKLKIAVRLIAPPDATENDLIEFFIKEKDFLTSSFAHELGHAYNMYKKGVQSVKSMGEYQGVQSSRFPFEPITNFLHYVYFTHAVENIVRPIEVASLMKSGNIDREKFYDFLLSNRTYKMLKTINSFSYEEMRNELKKEKVNIRKFLRDIGANPKGMNDDELVDELLRIVYVNIANESLSTIQANISNDFLENLFGIVKPEKQNFFSEMVKYFTRFGNNPEKFYLSEEKRMKLISEKMMKKLSKLYDLAKVKKSSIINWDLHQKLNNKDKKIVTEFKYKIKETQVKKKNKRLDS